MKTIIKTIIGMTLVGGWITTGIMNAPPDTPEEARAKLIGMYEFAELNLRLATMTKYMHVMTLPTARPMSTVPKPSPRNAGRLGLWSN